MLYSAASATGLGWAAGSDLPQPAVEYSKAVRYQDFVYVIGGRTDSGSGTGAVRMARIQANGTLGTWTDGRALPNSLYFHAAAVVNRHIFVIGGWDGSSWRREVWRASIQNDGSLGEWSNAGAYPIEIALHGVIGVGSRIYVVGGQNNASGALTEVRFADVQANGTLGAWNSTISLPAPRYRFSVTAANGYLYATGGYDGASAQNSIYYAKINDNGTIQPWQLANFAPAQGRYYHSSHVSNGRLTLVGGHDGSSELTSVCSAPLIEGFPSAPWTCDEPPLPLPLQRFAAVTYPIAGKDAILVMGGHSGNALQSKSYILTEPGMDLTLYNTPTGFVAPSQEIEYTVRYQNRPFFDLANVSVAATVPVGAKLVPNSQGTGAVSDNGNQITWNINPLGKDATGAFSYRVRRDHPVDTISSRPSITSALGITKTGPLLAEVGKPFTYTLAVTTTIHFNHALVVMDTLPDGVDFVTATTNAGGVPQLLPGNFVSVTFANPDFQPGQTVTVALQVMPTQAGVLENGHYAVLGGHDPTLPLSRTSGDVIFYNADGLMRVMTVALPPGGDGSKIVHMPMQANWTYQSSSGTAMSNWISNPHNNLNLRLPLIFR